LPLPVLFGEHTRHALMILPWDLGGERLEFLERLGNLSRVVRGFVRLDEQLLPFGPGFRQVLQRLDDAVLQNGPDHRVLLARGVSACTAAACQWASGSSGRA